VLRRAEAKAAAFGQDIAAPQASPCGGSAARPPSGAQHGTGLGGA